MLASSSSQPHSHTDTYAHPYGNGNGNSTDNDPPSDMPSPQGGANDLFPLDFLTFSNFDASSPHHNQNSGSISNGEKDQNVMDFDLAQFQQTLDGAGEGQSNHSHTQSHSGNASGSGSRRGSIDKRSGRGRVVSPPLLGLEGWRWISNNRVKWIFKLCWMPLLLLVRRGRRAMIKPPLRLVYYSNRFVLPSRLS
jgi:hypothetical protein